MDRIFFLFVLVKASVNVSVLLYLLLSNSQLEKDLVFQRCTVSSADWAVLTCFLRWVQSVSFMQTLLFRNCLTRNDFSRRVAKCLFTVELEDLYF